MIGWRTRPLRSLQVEVTSRCSLHCSICPRTHIESWIDRDLSDAAWQRLEPDLRLAQDVHLQGWGEPLLDDALRARVRAAHAAGCTVGLTTNAVALAADSAWIAAERVERVSVSIGAGATAHAAQRGQISLDCIWSAVSALVAARTARTPRVLVSALLTADGAEDLPAIVRDAAAAGADEVYVTHIDCAPARDLLERTAFAGGRLRPGFEEAIRAAADAARRSGIRFRQPSQQAEDMLVCSLDPTRFAFVSCDGRIGPCVNMLLPIRACLRRWCDHGVHVVEPEVWGRLPADSLATALASPARRGFLSAFTERLEAERAFRNSAAAGWGPPALWVLEEADRQRSRALAAAPFPPACAGCHKRWGW